MSDDLIGKLDRMLDKYDDRRRQQVRAQDDVRKIQDVFLDKFTAFRRDVAKPLFEQVGQHLRSRGHDFEIVEQESVQGRDAVLGLVLYPQGVERGAHDLQSYPSFTLVASPTSKSVRLHGSNMRPQAGGSSGPRGAFKLEQLTRNVVEDDLMKLLGEIFRG